jgi:hypothetical protein
MAKVKDNKDKPSYGFTGAVKEKLLGIDPATVGFSQIMSETFNPATMFGSESFLAKAFASEGQRERRAGVEKGKPIGFTSEVIEKQTQEQQKITEEQTKEIKETIKETVTKPQTKKEDPREKLKDPELENQTDRVIAKLDEVKAAVVAFSGGSTSGGLFGAGGFFGSRSNKSGTGGKGKGFFGNTLRNIGVGLGSGFGLNKIKNKFFPSVKDTLPKGTKLNSAGRLIDEKTGKFVKEPDELKDAKQKVDTKTKAKPNVSAAKNKTKQGVMSKVRNKLATKVGAKTATKGAFAGTGVGVLVAGGLTAYDIGEYALSKSARMQYDLALGGEEKQDEAFNWLLENDPEVLGVPEQVPQDKRMEFLTLQNDYPDQSEEDILKTMNIDNDATIKRKEKSRDKMEAAYTDMLQEEGMGGRFFGMGLNTEGEQKLQELMAAYDEGQVTPNMVNAMNKNLEALDSDVRFDASGNKTTVQALMDAEENANLNNMDNVDLEAKTIEVNETLGQNNPNLSPTIVAGNNQPPTVNVSPNVTVTLPREIKPITESSRRFVSYENP